MPRLLGAVTVGDAQDVAIQGTYAYVADLSSSFTVVDISNLQNPQVVASTPLSLGGRLFDVAVDEGFAFGADAYFVNGIPIIDIQTAGTAIPRAILDFSAYGDENGTGIALDGNYVYLTADKAFLGVKGGTTGQSRLYIGQYLDGTDARGVPPTVNITEPPTGAQIIRGETITIDVSASDDIGVAYVQLFANGVLVGSDSIAPYEFTYTAPVASGQVILTANATDFGSNKTVSAANLVEIVPDPNTIIVGRIVDGTGQPVVGATAVALGTFSSISDSGGQFRINGVPTIRGDIAVSVTFSGLYGESARFAVKPNGVVDVGTIVTRSSGIFISKITQDNFVFAGEPLVIYVTGGGPGLTIRLYLDGVVLAGSSVGGSLSPYFHRTYALGQMTFTATARNAFGNEVTLASQQLAVISDPGTIVTGRVVNEAGQPVAGALVYVPGNSTLTDANGEFQVPGVPTVDGDILASAYAGNLFGESLVSLPPVRGGVTNTGTITLRRGGGGSGGSGGGSE